MRSLCVRSAAFSALLAFSLCAPNAFAQDAKIEQAKQHMQAGAAFYNDPSGRKCEEAYREFSKAYELSGSLNALKGMGVCALELERDGEAIEYLSKVLAEKKDLSGEEKAQVQADIGALKSAVAWVTVSATEDGVKLMDVRTPTKGFPIRNRYDVGTTPSRLGIHPGSHTFEARSASGEVQTWNIDISNGSTHQHAFEFGGGAAAVPPPVAPPPGAPPPAQPPPDEPDEVTEDDPRPIPTTVYIFGGLTIALAVPTVIFMVSASGARSDFDDQNGNASAAELDDLRGDVTTMNLLSDIFLGATVAGAAATAIFYFTRPTVETQSGGYWTLAPSVSRDGGGAAVLGAF